MQGRLIGITALIIGGFAATAAAQNTGPVDVSRLPIDVNRIQKQLRETSIREEHESPFRLRYVVDVYGIAPRIEIFTDKNTVLSGPVPWAAPSHRDMLEVMTPREYRAPAADFGALARWLADKTAGRSRK
jgi:hypothetical protein